jgi:hypothetical protein
MNKIWAYLSHKFDEEGVIEDWHTIAENLDGQITLDEFDEIHPTVIRFMNIHDLTDIVVHYAGEPRRRVPIAQRHQEIRTRTAI